MQTDYNLITNDIDPIMYIVDRPLIAMTRGEGSWLWDNNGKKYLDFIQGWAVNCLGHCHPSVIKAITEQAKILINPSPAYYNKPMIDLATRLVNNSVFDKVFFTNSGAEANEGAIKLARKWGLLNKKGAYEIITLDHSFHGRTLATMSASGKAQFEPMFEPKVPGFKKANINDINSVKALINDNTVAVMLEPIQGEAGVIPATLEYMKELRKLTTENGILLIVDEIQTGMGRTGKLFAYEWSGISPDIMTLGKGIGAGVPLAALLSKKEVSCFVAGEQGGTYNGNPLMTAVGIAVIDLLTSTGFFDDLQIRSEYLTEKLIEISQKFGLGEVRGRGMLQALNTGDKNSSEIVKKAMENGLILNAPRPDTLRFMPSLLTSKDEIDLMINILSKSM
jgi:acetylornithine/N-succinyldiaminopimelate aminotransferase